MTPPTPTAGQVWTPTRDVEWIFARVVISVSDGNVRWEPIPNGPRDVCSIRGWNVWATRHAATVTEPQVHSATSARIPSLATQIGGKLIKAGTLTPEAWNALVASCVTEPAPQSSNLTADDVQWVTNDNSELGVKIGDRFFFLYKGCSIEYRTGLHDDESPMRWRLVYKREFGECCHPWETIKRQTGVDRLPDDFQAAYGDPLDWQDLPRHLTPAEDDAEYDKRLSATIQAEQMRAALAEIDGGAS